MNLHNGHLIRCQMLQNHLKSNNLEVKNAHIHCFTFSDTNHGVISVKSLSSPQSLNLFSVSKVVLYWFNDAISNICREDMNICNYHLGYSFSIEKTPNSTN